jgi:hypothetical protein
MAIYLISATLTYLQANNTASLLFFINVCKFVSEALNKTRLHVYLTSGGVLVDKHQDP